MSVSKSVSSALLFVAYSSFAHDAVYLPAVNVDGNATSLIGEAITASQGYAGTDDLDQLVLDGAGGVLEAVPGMTATQHSASGKANQYFLRGFNLDHGTDFAVSVDGMQVNTPSHGHGQGYADMNFVIPEFVSMVSYLKGPYYSMIGDFASSGSANLGLVDVLAEDFVALTLGEYDHQRLVVGKLFELDQGEMVSGFEIERNDGPWDLDENLKKENAMLRFSTDGFDTKTTVTAMAYSSSWDATDQIPSRLVESGAISKYGYVDPTVGGRSSRYSLSLNWRKDSGHTRDFLTAYAGYYDLNLWSNFTYFLENPEQGDQIEQADRRSFYGITLGRTFFYHELLGLSFDHTVALSGRWDDVDAIGLYHTSERERLDTVREDELRISQRSLAYELKVDLSQSLRLFAGARLDNASFHVASDLEANSGEADDWLASPKLNLVYTPNASWEWYVSAGRGFHSNDARGTTISVDPTDGVTPVDAVDPLVSSEGIEVGGRYTISEKLNTSFALWSLDLDSELLYVGDGGATEASDSSRRSGFDWTTFYALDDHWGIDFDYALSDAAFVLDDGVETYIPGVVEERMGAGIRYHGANGVYGSLRYRYVGGRPLIEDGSVYAPTSKTATLKIGYSIESWDLEISILNLFDADDYDIAYLYESRLPGESEAVEDIHYHVMKPQTINLSVRRRF